MWSFDWITDAEQSDFVAVPSVIASTIVKYDYCYRDCHISGLHNCRMTVGYIIWFIGDRWRKRSGCWRRTRRARATQEYRHGEYLDLVLMSFELIRKPLDFHIGECFSTFFHVVKANLFLIWTWNSCYLLLFHKLIIKKKKTGKPSRRI